MTDAIRRVVTGLDEQGRSTILFDDSFPVAATKVLWQTDALPADNSGRTDAGSIDFSFDMFRHPGSTFMLAQFQPGDTAGDPFMHATDTIDYIVMLKGRIELFLDTGSIILGPGDCIVDRGVMHGWKVVGDEQVVMITVLLPAAPVGTGATV